MSFHVTINCLLPSSQPFLRRRVWESTNIASLILPYLSIKQDKEPAYLAAWIVYYNSSMIFSCLDLQGSLQNTSQDCKLWRPPIAGSQNQTRGRP
jgi:hypothetical protein